MSSVKIQGNASGSGQFTVASPNSNNTRTATLPDADGNVVLDTATQTLTNKTLSTGLVMGASAITSGTAQASTSGTSIDFTGIPSWVKRITLMLSGVSLSGTDGLRVQLGTASGLENTGYVGSLFSVYDGATPNVSAFSSSFVLTTSSTGASAGNTYYGQFICSKVDGNTWVATYTVSPTTTSISARFANGSGGKTLSGTLDRISLVPSGSNTFDAGTVNILYE